MRQERLQLRAGLLAGLVRVCEDNSALRLGCRLSEALQDVRLQVAAGTIQADHLRTQCSCQTSTLQAKLPVCHTLLPLTALLTAARSVGPSTTMSV